MVCVCALRLTCTSIMACALIYPLFSRGLHYLILFIFFPYSVSSHTTEHISTTALLTKSGLPVFRYALGGAARSTQPQSLPSLYYDHVVKQKLSGNSCAPFYFYYNPHRYPAFMAGVQDVCAKQQRKDIFVASGGSDLCRAGMEQRLRDCFLWCGGEYLDMFVLEYVCPEDLNDYDELQKSIEQAQTWKQQGLIRYVAASTHSHVVGSILAKDKGIDALMLRYSMSHKDAADKVSFPSCVKNNKAVLAFTTTRWNALQGGHEEWSSKPPSTGDCLSFALASSSSSSLVKNPVELVLHSARNEEELEDAINGLHLDMSAKEVKKWREYGDLDWNADGFDEYPEERLEN